MRRIECWHNHGVFFEHDSFGRRAGSSSSTSQDVVFFLCRVDRTSATFQGIFFQSRVFTSSCMRRIGHNHRVSLELDSFGRRTGSSSSTFQDVVFFLRRVALRNVKQRRGRGREGPGSAESHAPHRIVLSAAATKT
jgi:hypothetical protein